MVPLVVQVFPVSAGQDDAPDVKDTASKLTMAPLTTAGGEETVLEIGVASARRVAPPTGRKIAGCVAALVPDTATGLQNAAITTIEF
jgi:hypothetical protein